MRGYKRNIHVMNSGVNGLILLIIMLIIGDMINLYITE